MMKNLALDCLLDMPTLTIQYLPTFWVCQYYLAGITKNNHGYLVFFVFLFLLHIIVVVVYFMLGLNSSFGVWANIEDSFYYVSLSQVVMWLWVRN